MIIIKAGGGKTINWDYLAQDPILKNEKTIVVHGANAWMEEIAKSMGFTQKTIISPSGHTSRYTDGKTMELLTMVYSGLVNKKIVAAFQKYQINAVGLTGADGRLWLARKKEAILAKENGKTKLITDSLTGKVEKVNTKLLKVLLGENFLPVITIPAITESGELVNVDNDRAVSVMVKDLNVKTIVFLFEAPGLLENPGNPSTKIDKIDRRNIDIFLNSGKGRMKKKLLGVKECILAGAEKIYFGDGRIRNPVSSALQGKGTVIS